MAIPEKVLSSLCLLYDMTLRVMSSSFDRSMWCLVYVSGRSSSRCLSHDRELQRFSDRSKGRMDGVGGSRLVGAPAGVRG